MSLHDIYGDASALAARKSDHHSSKDCSAHVAGLVHQGQYGDRRSHHSCRQRILLLQLIVVGKIQLQIIFGLMLVLVFGINYLKLLNSLRLDKILKPKRMELN